MSDREQNMVKKRILSYLVRHPDAQDTIEGIVNWWLLEERIVSIAKDVEEALSSLVNDGWLLKIVREDKQESYKVNMDRLPEIITALRLE